MATQVDRIIDAFGNANRLADALDINPSTVHSWKRSGYIPSKRHEEIILVARSIGISILPDDFFSLSLDQNTPNTG